MKIGRRTSEEEIGFTESIYIARNICCAFTWVEKIIEY